MRCNGKLSAYMKGACFAGEALLVIIVELLSYASCSLICVANEYITTSRKVQPLNLIKHSGSLADTTRSRRCSIRIFWANEG